MDKQPSTVEEALQICEDVSKNFGDKKSKYQMASPLTVELAPLSFVRMGKFFQNLIFMFQYCEEDIPIANDINAELAKKAIDIKLKLERSIDILNFMQKSSAAKKMTVIQFIQGIHIQQFFCLQSRLYKY